MNPAAPIPEPLPNDSGDSPSGFRPSRARREQGAGSREQGACNQGSIRDSSRSMALAETRPEAAMADVLVSLRPDWTFTAALAAMRADDRPWRTVVLAAIRGATNPDIRHPNGLRYVNPADGTHTPTPPTPAQLNDPRLRCDNGAMIQATGYCCALCRNGVTP